MGQFYAGSIKKLSRVLEIVQQQYMKGNGRRHSEHLSLFKKCTILQCLPLFALS